MTTNSQQMEAERESLLSQLRSLDRLRRGSLSRQVYSRKKDGADHPQGPYFVLQGFHQGRKFSQRIPAARAPQVQQQVNNFKRFQALADQCITLTDQITQAAEAQTGSKKNSSGRKSSRRASRKPRLS